MWLEERPTAAWQLRQRSGSNLQKHVSERKAISWDPSAVPLTLSPGRKGLSATLEKSIACQGKSYRSLLGMRWGRDLPGGPVVKNLPSKAGGSTWIPVGELRGPQQPSRKASTRERPTFCDKEPKHRKQRPCVPQRTPTQPKRYQQTN